jgi:chromosomal replication initiator protein
MGRGLPTVERIQRAVCREYGVSFDKMRQPAPTERCFHNTYDVSRPRQTAMALAFLLTEHSQTRIGQFFGGRDHTTVRHAREVVAKRRRSDPELHEKMRRLTLELVRG